MSDSFQPPAVTPANPPPPPSQDERTMAMLCHLLGLLTGFVGPLILWLMKKDESHFVNHHGKEALNFQITVTIVVWSLSILAFILSFVFIGILLFPVILVLVILALIAEILSCVSASRGEWSRYPGCIRLVA